MIRIRDDVNCRLSGLRPEMLVALMVVERVFSDLNYGVELTGGTELGSHSKKGWHPRGLAFGISFLPALAAQPPGDHELIRRHITTHSATRLGRQFKVFNETTHLHVQWNVGKPSDYPIVAEDWVDSREEAVKKVQI